MNDTTTNIDVSRRSIYALLIMAAAGMTAGHIAAVERIYEPSAFKPEGEAARPSQVWPAKRPTPTSLLRSNDRSRWATVRALVDEGTYVVGRRDSKRATRGNPYGDYGIVFEDGWETVDKVLRPDTEEFYSSKPPFLATIVAGEYWLLKRAFGWNLSDEKQRGWIVRVVLATFNLLPFVIFLFVLGRLADGLAETDWARLFIVVAGCFGTFVTAFTATLNNHTLAACCAIFALAPALRIWNGERSVWLFAVAGLFTGLTACLELPAAALAAGLLVAVLRRSVPRTLLFFVPALALPVVGFFLANHAALGQWRPAYSELGGPWYEYAGSHWRPVQGIPKTGIDWASEKESRAAYVFHFLIGHHGIFSLTPLWLLTVAGLLMTLKANAMPAEPARMLQGIGSIQAPPRAWSDRRMLAALTLVVSVVVIGFYLGRQRWNYGGGTAGPRWLIWLTPLWLLALAPAADRLGRARAGRALALLLLAISAFSAAYPLWSPWRHPWIYNAMEAIGWGGY